MHLISKYYFYVKKILNTRRNWSKRISVSIHCSIKLKYHLFYSIRVSRVYLEIAKEAKTVIWSINIRHFADANQIHFTRLKRRGVGYGGGQYCSSLGYCNQQWRQLITARWFQQWRLRVWEGHSHQLTCYEILTKSRIWITDIVQQRR